MSLWLMFASVFWPKAPIVGTVGCGEVLTICFHNEGGYI